MASNTPAATTLPATPHTALYGLPRATAQARPNKPTKRRAGRPSYPPRHTPHQNPSLIPQVNSNTRTTTHLYPLRSPNPHSIQRSIGNISTNTSTYPLTRHQLC